jgi:hypothetical protein
MENVDKEMEMWIKKHNGVLFNHEEEWNQIICWKMDGTGDHHVKWNKTVPQRQIWHGFSHLWKLGGNKTKQPGKGEDY